MAVTTQLYCQIYITCQLHVSANTILAIIRFGTIFGENYTIYNMMIYIIYTQYIMRQYDTMMVILYNILQDYSK